MKNICIILLVLIAFSSCKKESKAEVPETTEQTEVKKELTEDQKKEIVKYYLINGRNLPETDFHEIIFLNDAVDGVKVIHYEGRDAFFGFKFSDALNFYNANKK